MPHYAVACVLYSPRRPADLNGRVNLSFYYNYTISTRKCIQFWKNQCRHCVVFIFPCSPASWHPSASSPRRRYLLAGGLSQTGESNAATQWPCILQDYAMPRGIQSLVRHSATALRGLERYLHSAPSGQRIFWILPLQRGARPGKNLPDVPIFIIICRADSI